MKKNYWLGLIILLVIAGAIFVYFEGGCPFFSSQPAKPEVETGVGIGQLAPDFSLSKVNGDTVTLSSLRGKKVFLNFWATWCPPCQSEMPDIQKLYQENKEIEILAVDLREARGKVAEYLLLNGYSYPVVLDQDGKVGEIYQVRGIPTTYIIDENGIIAAKEVGALSYDKMVELLN